MTHRNDRWRKRKSITGRVDPWTEVVVEAYSGVPGLCGAACSSGESLPVLLQEGDDITLQTEHGTSASPAVFLVWVLQVGQCSDAHVSQFWGRGDGVRVKCSGEGWVTESKSRIKADSQGYTEGSDERQKVGCGVYLLCIYFVCLSLYIYSHPNITSVAISITAKM